LLVVLIALIDKKNNPQLLHPPMFDIALFPLDAIVRTTAIVGSISLLSPSSASANQLNPLYVNSPLTHMIIGALASAGGGMTAGTLGTWKSQWGFNTPPVLRAGVGIWGSLDVWGGSLVGMIYLLAPLLFFVTQPDHTAIVYGVATNHPAFQNLIPMLIRVPLLSQIIQLAHLFSDPSVQGLIPLEPAEARALGSFVLTLLFGLRVYNVHWSGAAPTKGKGKAKVL